MQKYSVLHVCQKQEKFIIEHSFAVKKKNLCNYTKTNALNGEPWNFD